MRKVFFTVSAVVALGLAFASCNKQDYNCTCTIDAPEVTGVAISLDYDTTIVLKDKTEEIANTECEAYEQGSSILIPSGASGNVSVDCSI